MPLLSPEATARIAAAKALARMDQQITRALEARAAFVATTIDPNALARAIGEPLTDSICAAFDVARVDIVTAVKESIQTRLDRRIATLVANIEAAT